MMRGFVKAGAGFELQLSDGWQDLLLSLTEQLVELLEDEADESVPEPNEFDPFAAWEAEFGEADTEHQDPALRRLFPNPYPNDPEAAADHRRFSEPGLRREKLADARVVLDFLRAGAEDEQVQPDQVPAWLRTLNAQRLVLASRLGVEQADDLERIANLPDDDPRWMMGAVMDVIGELQAQLIEVGQ